MNRIVGLKRLSIGLICITLTLITAVTLTGCASEQPGVFDWLKWNMNQKSGLPVYSGIVEAGVSAPVEIYFDEYGVPHIFADHEADMIYAQGYVMAMERLFQMDMTRRAIAGQLAEIVGPTFLQDDRFNRTVGFYRAAELSEEALTPETRLLLEAFAAGVNDYIEQNLDNLSPEFILLGYTPEPWRSVDSLAVSKMMAWQLGGNMNTELFLAAMLEEVGLEKTLELFPFYPEGGMTITGPEFSGISSAAALRLIELGNLAGLAPREPGIGSNNWVVSGDHTASGGAILASDMHLGLGLPPIWYMNHLSIPGQNVTGVMFPGIPGVIAGFNDHIAWGETNLGPDVMDLYQIKFNEDDDSLYLYNDEWLEAEIIEEVIKVRGEEDELLRIRVTSHGPVITDVTELQPGAYPLSLRWVALEATLESEAMLGMIRATNFEQFRAALTNFMAPAQNFVYADTEGNIGYLGNGLFPIKSESHRESGNGLLPVPGWTDEYEWTGFVPWEEIPFLYNPPAGIIVTANHKAVDDSYPYFLSYEWAHPSRAQSILRELEGRDNLNLEDMKAIQASFYNSHAEEMAPVLVEILQRATLSDPEQQALTVLAQWADYPVETADSAAAAIFHTFYPLLAANIFTGQVPEPLLERLIGYSYPVLDQMVISGDSLWFDDRDELVAESFRQAVAKLSAELGENVMEWQWGDIHTLTFKHYLGDNVSEKKYNRGPFPVGGSGSSPAALGFSRRLDLPFQVRSAAPWRYVIDLSDHTAYDMLAIGNSGHFRSPHYDDLLQMWLNFEYKPRLIDQLEIKKAARLLTLKPY